MKILKSGTHYIACGDNGLETSFVLSGREKTTNTNGIASGLIVKDGEVTEQTIAVRALGDVSDEIRMRFLREAAICFESVRGWSDPYEHITEPLFAGACLVAPEVKIPVFIRKYVPDHWVVLGLESGEIYAGKLKIADTSSTNEERDLVLEEPALYNSDTGEYISTSYQYMFIKSKNLYSIATVHEPTIDKRVVPIGNTLFTGGENNEP